jgi:hypothetical protein
MEADLAQKGLNLYHLKAPAWRAPLLKKADGELFPGFFPTNPCQEENQLTDSVVKQGFASRSVVQVSFITHTRTRLS